jgi:hypothetical protein
MLLLWGAVARTYVRISWMRCSGSSFACAALGCDRAGLVNQLWMGAVIGRSPGGKVLTGALAFALVCAGLRRSGMGLWFGEAGATCVTEQDYICRHIMKVVALIVARYHKQTSQ